MENKLDTSSLLGVITGGNPYSGLGFVQNIFANTKAEKDQDHLNCIFISCPSIISYGADFILKNTDKDKNPALGIFESVKCLYNAGVRLAVVASSTAHCTSIFSVLKDMVKNEIPEMKLINIIETSAEHLKNSMKTKKIGLIASMAVFKNKVYHDYFKEEDGFNLLEPEFMGQEKIHDALRAKQFGVNQNPHILTNKALNVICNEIYRLIDRGAEAVILGSTEFSQILVNQEFSVPLIDPGLLAVRKMIEMTDSNKLTPYLVIEDNWHEL